MEKIIRSLFQVGAVPDAEDVLMNWRKFQDYELEHQSEADKQVLDYLRTFYDQMSAPPEVDIMREFFEKQDNIEAVSRIEEVSKVQWHISTNFLSLVRQEQDQQHTKKLAILCRDASAIAEHGRTQQSQGGKKVTLRGVADAVDYLYENLHEFARVEGGEKLEAVVTDDAEEFLEEYEKTEKVDKFANRNLFGLEPVDSVCKGHRRGEFWVHTAFTGELKCIPGDSKVFDHSGGRRRSIRDLFDSGDLPTVHAAFREGSMNRMVLAKADHLVENGVREVFEMRLDSGRRTSATENHGFLTLSGWRKLGDIRQGDYVAVPKRTRVCDFNRSFTDGEVKVVGYLLGDGYVGGKRVTFTALNDEIRHDFMECLRSMGLREGPADGITPNFMEEFPKERTPGVRMSNAGGGGNTSFVSPVRELLECLRMAGKVAATKRIPDELFGVPEEQVCLLLGSLWSTDGSLHAGDHERDDRDSVSRRNDIKYYSTSEGLCLDVQSFLLRIGVNSTVTSYEIEYLELPYTVYVTRVVGSKNKRNFLQKVHIVGKEVARELVLSRLSFRDDDMYPSSIIPDGSKAVLASGRTRHASQCRRETVSGEVVAAFARSDDRVRAHYEGDFMWERVESVTSRGPEMTYDLSVPEHHSFVVDDIVSHNTTLSLNYAYNNVMVYGKNIFYAILEMPYSQLRRQLYVIHSSHGKFISEWHKDDGYVGLDYRKVRDGELSPKDKKRLQEVAKDFKESAKGKLYVWRPKKDEEGTIAGIRRKAEMFDNKYGCDGLVIDHLGLVTPKRHSQDNVATQNAVVRDARLMALNFARGKGVPLLGLWQMNRQGKMRAEKNDGHYDIAAISYANEIEKSADVITYTYLSEQLRRDGKFYLGNLKNRDNPMFERMIGKILWTSKRIRALETGMLDLSADVIVNASRKISAGLESMYNMDVAV